MIAAGCILELLGENYTLIYLWVKGVIRVSPHKSVEKSRNFHILILYLLVYICGVHSELFLSIRLR